MLCGFLGLTVAQAGTAEEVALKTQKEMLSYGIGVSVARNFRKQQTDVDMAMLMKGLKDGLSGEKLLMPERDLRRVMNAYQVEARQKALADRRMAIEDNRKKGDTFLQENKAREGVVALPSGLQYKIVKAGDGRKPTDSDMVQCNYRGTLLDGTEFDGTESGHPATLKMSSLITGWKEALKLMPAGSRWQIAIPPQLAYGERGVGGDIGPNETLLFDVELVAVN